MKPIFAAACVVGILALAGQARAADYDPPPQAAPIEAAKTWQGFYIGGSGGWGKSTDSSDPSSGWLAGGHIGYNVQVSNLVLGLIGDISASNFGSTTIVVSPPITLTGTTKADILSTIRGKAGFAAGPVLLYGTAGAAFAHNKISIAVAPLGISASDSQWHTGWTAGGGLEFAPAPNWSVFVEYLYASLASKNYTLAGFTAPSGDEKLNAVRGGFSVRFN